MDDFIGSLVGIAVVVGFAIFVLGLMVSGAVWVWVNLLVLFDTLLGGFPFPSPVLSWAFNGLVVGSGLHFAFNESARVASPRAKQVALVALAGYLLLALTVSA